MLAIAFIVGLALGCGFGVVIGQGLLELNLKLPRIAKRRRHVPGVAVSGSVAGPKTWLRANGTNVVELWDITKMCRECGRRQHRGPCRPD